MKATLILSLDFELHWGVFDHCAPGDPYERNLHGARKAIPLILDLFERYDAGATWAVVGALFAKDSAMLKHFWPSPEPGFRNSTLLASRVQVGNDEVHDPLHYAPSLIERILKTPRQEVGTHTFAHIYCNEPDMNAEAFNADLRAATSIAAEYGISVASIVFPRNQANPDLLPLLPQHGITVYRGPGPNEAVTTGLPIRILRAIDSIVPVSGSNTIPFRQFAYSDGLSNVRSSRFLRPVEAGWARPRLNRILSGMKEAARTDTAYHLWWHPHNFGGDPIANLTNLEKILKEAKELGMEIRGMTETARLAAES